MAISLVVITRVELPNTLDLFWLLQDRRSCGLVVRVLSTGAEGSGFETQLECEIF